MIVVVFVVDRCGELEGGVGRETRAVMSGCQGDGVRGEGVQEGVAEEGLVDSKFATENGEFLGTATRSNWYRYKTRICSCSYCCYAYCCYFFCYSNC